MEDSVVEHDARQMPGFDLVESHLTGRAVFTRNDQRLEIFTANRRDLEHVFGVDLIYLNASIEICAVVRRVCRGLLKSVRPLGRYWWPPIFRQMQRKFERVS
jgi:hypothetical protein